MASPDCDRAIEDAIDIGKAILKFISANDVDLTGGHQYGYYLPKPVWELYTVHAPIKGVNNDHFVQVLWPDGRVTNSKVKWYGKTKSEYRLTTFGRNFPYRTFDNLGDLLVVIPKTLTEFACYVLSGDDDIEEIQAALDVEVLESWNVYIKGQEVAETEDACLNRKFREFAEAVIHFPEVKVFSDATLEAILECIPTFKDGSVDEQLVRLVTEEYNLFKMVERKIFQPEVQRLFKSIDDFISTALKIINARKPRAGRSLENHVEYLLTAAEIPFEMRKTVDNTRPDIIIPGKAEYDDPDYPVERLAMVGVKTTCKDRWRQVMNEAPRIERKHILTLQEGITSKQLDEMYANGVTLVVPRERHKDYPPNHPITLLDLEEFIDSMKALLA